MSLKQVENKKKTIFKPILNNNFTEVNFPMIDSQAQQEIKQFLIHLIEPPSAPTSSLNSDGKDTPFVLGFNSVVKVLEKQADPSSNDKTHQPLDYVFVCKPDIQPQLIIQHFPTLCFMASKQHPVKLVQLPRGTAPELEAKLNSKTTIIGLRKNSSMPSQFLALLDSVAPVDVPWLSSNIQFEKPNIKFIETTQPIITKTKKKPTQS